MLEVCFVFIMEKTYMIWLVDDLVVMVYIFDALLNEIE